MKETRKEIRRHLGRRIRKLNNVLMRSLQLTMRGRGVDELTVMNGWIIAYLHNNSEKEIYQKDIETEFSIGRSAVTTLLARMEEKGFVCRQTDVKDARLKKLSLTEKGEEQFRLIDSTIEWINIRQTDGITEEELEQMYATMKKIADNTVRLNALVTGADTAWLQEIEEREENKG